MYCLTKKELEIEAARQRAFDEKHAQLENFIKAFGSHGIGCGHIHTFSPYHTEMLEDEESQHIMPLNPKLEIEEAEDRWIQVGKVGEFITSVGEALAIGPLLDILLLLINPNISTSAWFKPNVDMQVSPAILFISLALLTPAVYGAPHCHAQLEIASRTRHNFIILAKYTQRLLTWGNKQGLQINDPQLAIPSITVGNNEIFIDEFMLIDPTTAASLSLKQKFQIFGDVEQHFNEYVGLTIIAILGNVENTMAQSILITTILFVAAIACWPEVTTCFNTLILMNELEHGNIINNPNSANIANWQTTFSAIAKTPAVLYANLLSFQQICFGNFSAGFVLALLATTGNITTQYFINKHTQELGESQSNATETIEEDTRQAWQKLSFFGKTLVIARAFGTGNERSEPITIIVIALCSIAGRPFSPMDKAILAAILCLVGTITAYSEARNAADHMARVRFFTTPTLPRPPRQPSEEPLLTHSMQIDQSTL